jgi:hypothetical protein
VAGEIFRIEYIVDVRSIPSLKGRKRSVEGKPGEDAIGFECAKRLGITP